MHSVYCGSEYFAREISGYEMAIAIRDALQDRHPRLAKSLRTDPEAGGVELASKNESDLRRALEVAVAVGLLRPGFADDLDDELDRYDVPLDSDVPDGDELVFPVSAYKVSGTRLIGSYSNPAFARGPEREMPVDELALRARLALASDKVFGDVGIETDDWRVTVDAPDLDTLRAACVAIGTVGLAEDAEDLFDILRQEAQAPGAERALTSGPYLQTPNGPWEATTPWSDAPFPEERDTVGRLRRLYDFIEDADAERGSRVDLDRQDERLLVVGDERGDVEWAVDRLTSR